MTGTVYSSEYGAMCPRCERPLIGCVCARMHEQALLADSDGIVRVVRETKGRKGSGVTIITGLPLGKPDLTSLAKQLKKRCGSGGTVRAGVIEIQQVAVGSDFRLPCQTLEIHSLVWNRGVGTFSLSATSQEQSGIAGNPNPA